MWEHWRLPGPPAGTQGPYTSKVQHSTVSGDGLSPGGCDTEAVVTQLLEHSLWSQVTWVWIPVLPNTSCITLGNPIPPCASASSAEKLHTSRRLFGDGWVRRVESSEQCLPQSNHPICCCHCSMTQLLLNDARKKRVFDTVAPEDGGQRAASFQRMWKDRGKRLDSSWAHLMSLFVIPLEMSPKASHCRWDKSWISLWGWITDRLLQGLPAKMTSGSLLLCMLLMHTQGETKRT